MNLEEIQKANEQALKEMESQAETPAEESAENLPTPEVAEETLSTEPKLTPEEEAKMESLRSRVMVLQEKIKSYVEDLMKTDFTVEEVGYSADLFKNWVTIFTHDTVEFKELKQVEKDANDIFLAKKLSELTKLNSSLE